MIRAAVLLALLSLGAPGCAWNPVSGRPEVVLVSRAQEREMGEKESHEVADAMGLVDEPALVGYVSTVGQRLAEHAPGGDAHYTFHVVDTEEPNAFSLPGGYIYVSRALLALMNSEDELAGVVGHEIGHVAARHAAQRVTRAAPFAVVTGLGSAVTGIVSPMLGGVVGGIGGVAGSLVLAPYSRGQESEADRVGQAMAAAAGWDPAGLSRALRTLEREEALHAGEARPSSFFATHPPLPQRVADTAAHASTLRRGPSHPIAASPNDFLHKLDGLPIGARPGDGVVDGERFAHPDLGFTLRFPSGWKLENSRAAVGAAAPAKDAVIVLGSAGEGNDPSEALRALEKAAKVDLSSRAERLTIGDLPAVRVTAEARTDEGPVALELTWIAVGGRIYRLVGATSPRKTETYTRAFRDTAMSFRRLTAAERAGFHETRLRLVTGKDGETIGQLLARTGATAWNPEMTAVANELEPGSKLGQRQTVKVPLSEPYRPR